jgi:hypothetical protein
MEVSIHSMKSLTIKNIESIMEGIASEHLQINTVLKGNVWDVDLTKDVTGVYLIYEVTNIAPNGFNGIDYSIDIFLCDNVTEINTATNEVSVQNECSLIALDMMSIFENYNKTSWADKDLNLVLNKTWSIQPFTERFDSLYSGAAVNVSLSTSYGYARCQVPTKDPKNVSAPIVSGITWRGENLTTTDGVWEGTGVITFAYQWLRNGLAISGANENVYTLVAEDDYSFISCLVMAIDATGQESKISNIVGEVLGALELLSAPIISGNTFVGDTLTSTDGTWKGRPTITFAYQWRRNSVDILGATNSTYILVGADYANSIDCVVTATNPVGDLEASSNALAPIQGILPTNEIAPVISGVAERGEILTSTTGTWNYTESISYGYQWKRDNVNILGATENTYLLVEADDYTFITCLVTATDPIGSVSQISNTLGEVLGLPRILTNPILSGTEIIGETLSVTDGTWEGKPTITFSYQWRRDLANIGGATYNTYELADADYQTNIDCVVTAINDTGSVPQDSNDSGLIEGIIPSIIGVPTFSGNELVGETLTAISATTEGRPTPTRVLQWQRSDDGLSGWADIIGETSTTYILAEADYNKFVRVSQTETNGVGSDTANSISSGEIIKLSDVIFQAYNTRVVTDGGITENEACSKAFIDSIV